MKAHKLIRCSLVSLFIFMALLVVLPVQAANRLYGLTSTPTGAQQLPPTNASIYTIVRGHYDQGAKQLSLYVVMDQAYLYEVTAAQIRLGASGTTGPVLVDLGATGWIGVCCIAPPVKIVNFPPAYEADLFSGNTYITISTTAFPSGAIRGQLKLDTSMSLEILGRGVAHDVSADGSVIVGETNIEATPGAIGSEPFRWSTAGGLQRLGFPANATQICPLPDYPGVCSLDGRVTSVSADGNVMAVSVAGAGRLRYTFADGWKYVANAGGSVSDDGTSLAGGSNYWSSVFTGLPSYLTLPPGAGSATAYGLSGDGSVVVGGSDNIAGTYRTEALRWSVGPSGFTVALLPQLPGSIPNSMRNAALAVTPDGSVVVGYCSLGTSYPNPPRAVRWTSAGIEVLPLNTNYEFPAAGDWGTIAADVSADGRKILGHFSNMYGRSGSFLWTAQSNVKTPLGRIVNDAGFQFGVGLANAISRDGDTIVGAITQDQPSVEYAAAIRFGKAAAPYPAPSINGFWPGTAAAGSFVFVFGTGFVPGTTVRVNGLAAPLVQVLDRSLLIFMLPTGNTVGPITLTTPGGTASSSSNFGLVLSGLQITGLWPAEAKVGRPVFVFGNGFVPNQTTVSIGGASTSLVQVVSSTMLIFLVPPGASSGPVTVTTPTGGSVQSGGALTVLP